MTHEACKNLRRESSLLIDTVSRVLKLHRERNRGSITSEVSLSQTCGYVDIFTSAVVGNRGLYSAQEFDLGLYSRIIYFCLSPKPKTKERNLTILLAFCECCAFDNP